MKNVFIYGSLKRKLFNHLLISENPRNRFIRKGFIDGYKLYRLWSYPAIKESSKEDKLYVELYSLTDEVFDRINFMETRANYIPVEVVDDAGKVGIIYVYNGEVEEKNLVSSGNWTKDDEKLKIIIGVKDK